MFCNNVPAGKSDKILRKFNKINFSALPQGFFRHFRLYPPFRGNAEKSPFLIFLAPAARRKKISGNCLMCLKDNCQGFQKTPLEIMPGVSLPIFFMPKLKSFGVAPTSPMNHRVQWTRDFSGLNLPEMSQMRHVLSQTTQSRKVRKQVQQFELSPRLRTS